MDGGDPMHLDGYVYLCGRDSSDQTRGYSGSMAQLTMFNSALTSAHITSLFTLVGPSHFAARNRKRSLVTKRGSVTKLSAGLGWYRRISVQQATTQSYRKAGMS